MFAFAKSGSRSVVLLLTFSGLLLGATQGVALPPEEEAPSPGLEVITVTAERKEADLQEVPASISSFDADDILGRGLENVNDMQFQVPNFFSGNGLTRVTARGIGSEIVGPGVDPGFAVHVNGVFSSREGTGLLDFLDIERVEILRGPQGTRYGRNSTGGTINVITKRAEPDFDVFGDFQFSSYRDLLFRGVLNAPIVEDKLFARVAFLARFANGYTKNEIPDDTQRLNDAGTFGVRGTLSWLPTDDFRLDIIGAYADSNRNGSARKFQGDFFQGPTDGVGGPAGAGLLPGSDYTGAFANPGNPNRTVENVRQSEESHGGSATAIATYDHEQFTLSSITGYQYTDFELNRGQDGSSIDISRLKLEDRSWQVSQELLFQDPGDGHFDLFGESLAFAWLAGANYQYDKTPFTRLDLPNAQDTANSVRYNIADLSNFPPVAIPVAPAGVALDTFADLDTNVGSHIFGIFAGGDITLWDQLTVGGGVRWSYTKRNWNDTSILNSYLPLGSIFGPLLAQHVRVDGTEQEDDWDAVTGDAHVRWDFLENSSAYFNFSYGERFGGFQFLEVGAFDTEKVKAYEVGLRNRFWENRIQVNLTGFYNDYEDPQISQVVAGTPVTTNAPSARTYGVELEFDALITDEFLLNGSFGWLEARYDEDFFTTDTTIPGSAPQNINGNRLNRSPKFTVSVGAQYTLDFKNYGTLVPRIDFYYRDVVTFRQYDNPLDEADSYTRTDVRLTWTSPKQQFWVQAFVQNVENNEVRSGQETQASIYRLNYYAPPLTAGGRIGYYF
jgi:iron complex outermembrane receptor protein